MKIRRLHIGDYKIFQKFDLDFTHDGKALDLIVIAGINGSGKTTLLRDFIYHAFQNKPISENSFIETECQENGVSKNLIIDSRSPKERSFMFPKSGKVMFYDPGLSDKKSAKEAIVQFVDHLIYEKDKKSSEAYLITQKVLDSIFEDFDLQIEFRGLDRKREVLFGNKSANKIKIEELSGGEQELVTKAFSIHLADIRNSIILIDEPESSLHPNWQNRIARVYQDIADKNNNQIILATHSPHIAASVRKEQIRVLVKHENTIRAIADFDGSYGWKVEKVLLEIFGTKELRTPAVEEKLARLRNMLFADRYETEEFGTLQDELEKTVGYDDMDLVLIRMEIAKRKSRNEKNR